MPQAATESQPNLPTLGPSDRIIDRVQAASLLPRRSFGAHKWGVGGLVIVGGALNYFGAPILAAMAAARAGAGIVSLAAPRGVGGVVATAVPETTFIPLGDTESVAGAKQASERIGERLEKSTALLIGPGLGDDEGVGPLMDALFGTHRRATTIGFGFGPATAANGDESAGGVIGSSDRPLVIDADALNWLAKHETWPTLLPPGRAILTPHVGELARLTGKSTEELIADPVESARAAAKEWGQTVLFKYGYSVATDGEVVVVAPDAPLSLATAGTGDVLAGTVAAFLAQGLPPLDAAALAIYAGCRAARAVERRVGTLGLVASDLPLAIAAELAALERGGEE